MTHAEERGLFVISVAAALVGLHPQTLRHYERAGLVVPTRTAGGIRLYGRGDLVRLRRIAELTAEGVNLAGVRRVLELEEELAARDRRGPVPRWSDDRSRATSESHG
ncbi:MAG: MerR family transcriptional regulator [Actinomycetota bacterium]|nr:MerR family transcriptional regulator [Actinomycetota bacterium]